MRLLYLTRGCTVHDRRWLRLFAASGIETGFLPMCATEVATSCDDAQIELLCSPQLEFGTKYFQNLHAAVEEIRSEWRRWKPDVIMAGPLTDAGWVAMQIDPNRTLLASWAFDVLHEPAFQAEASRRLGETLARGRYLFADCADIASRCEILAQHPFDRSCVLPWGLAAEDLPSATTRVRQADSATLVLLHSRSFEDVYDPWTALGAFQIAQAAHPELRLWLVGDGSLRQKVKDAVERAGLSSVVRFLGQLTPSAVADALAQADGYLTCSRSDGSSLSLLQAMNAGLPCIVSDLPSNREWLDLEGGWLAPVGQVDAFAAVIRALKETSPETRKQMGRRNHLLVRERADLTMNFPRLLDTLEAIAQN